MALTLSEAQALRTAYYQALTAIASGKSYTIGTRTLTRADEKFVAEQFERYDRMADQIAAGQAPGGAVVRRVVPRDL